MTGQPSENQAWRIRWQVEWKWTPTDPLIWLTCLAGLVFIVLCVAYGWPLGAAMGGAFEAFLLTLYAFLTGHFIMSPNARWRALRGPDSGSNIAERQS